MNELVSKDLFGSFAYKNNCTIRFLDFSRHKNIYELRNSCENSQRYHVTQLCTCSEPRRGAAANSLIKRWKRCGLTFVNVELCSFYCWMLDQKCYLSSRPQIRLVTFINRGGKSSGNYCQKTNSCFALNFDSISKILFAMKLLIS